MKLGIDFDGVITDAEKLKVQWVLDNLGTKVTPEQLLHKKTSVIGVPAYERMVADIYAGHMALQNQVRPDAVSTLASFRARGDQIYIITARLNDQAVKARQLMAMHQVPHDCFVNTAETPKVQTCRELGIEVFVDDAHSTLLELQEIPGIKLVFFNVYGEPTAPGIFSASCWQEVEQFVNQLR